MDKVEIDGDTADAIVRASLKDSIANLRQFIKVCKSKKRLSEWDKEELAETKSALDYLEKTYDYYGGNLK